MRSSASSLKPAMPSTPRPPPGSSPADRPGRTGRAATSPTGRGPRAGRATARRSSGSPRARAMTGALPDLARRQIASRSSSDVLRSLASNAARELGVRDRQPDDVAEQRRARARAPDRWRPSCRRERGDLALGRVVVVEAEQPAPDLAPDEVAACSSRTTGTRRTPRSGRAGGRRARTPRRAATCPSRPRRRSPTTRPSPATRLVEARRRARPSSAVAADERQLEPGLAARRAFQRAVERPGLDRARPCP